MLIKCLIVLEGTGRGLNAEFNLIELLEPYRRQFILQQASPTRWLRRAKRLRKDWELLGESIPRSLSSLLDQLQSGNLTVRQRQPRLEAAVNRLVVGLCLTALLLASAMIWVHQVPPTIGGVSILGAGGYVAAALFATRLMWKIRWDRRNQD
jgi:ubiquinone biosynthesis protein